jgi:hypothetical protein
MTILSVVQNASLGIGVERPTVLFAQTTREALELKGMVNDCARMIAFDTNHDWTALKTLATITGDGLSLSFPKPDDYERMLKKAKLWPASTPHWPLAHIPDTDDWLGTQVQGAGLLGAWTMIGDNIHIREGGNLSPLSTGNVVSFYYVTTKYAKDGAGTPKVAFTADDDTFRLNERLLELALKYRWKQQKGQDYTEDMSDYENTLFSQIGKDKGSVAIAVGRPRVPSGATVAYPGRLG